MELLIIKPGGILISMSSIQPDAHIPFPEKQAIESKKNAHQDLLDAVNNFCLFYQDWIMFYPNNLYFFLLIHRLAEMAEIDTQTGLSPLLTNEKKTRAIQAIADLTDDLASAKIKHGEILVLSQSILSELIATHSKAKFFEQIVKIDKILQQNTLFSTSFEAKESKELIRRILFQIPQTSEVRIKSISQDMQTLLSLEKDLAKQIVPFLKKVVNNLR